MPINKPYEPGAYFAKSEVMENWNFACVVYGEEPFLKMSSCNLKTGEVTQDDDVDMFYEFSNKLEESESPPDEALDAMK